MPTTASPGAARGMVEGMVLAIEPMVNMGRPAVKVLADGWTAVTRDGSLSAHFEHTVAVTKDGPLSSDGADAPVASGGARSSRRRTREVGRTATRRAMTDDDPRDARAARSKARCSSTLPHGLYRVGIDRQRQVTAHVPSGPGRNFIRVLVGDRVRLQLSPRDLTRGRIVEVVR